MPVADLKDCPACERSRGDLGLTQACPACGCPPSDDLVTIRQWRPAADALLLAGAALFVIAISGRDLGRWTPAALLTLAACLIATRLLVTRRRRRAVLWQEGFALITWEEPPQTHAWAQYRAVALDEAQGVITFTPAARSPLEIPIHFFGSTRRATTFVTAAARHVSTIDP